MIVLTFNSEASIESTLILAAQISDDIHVVDSFSLDRTVELARRHSTEVVQHEFVNYGVQRNWAINSLSLKYDWQLHLDSDEQLSDGLIQELIALDPPREVNGYYIARLICFMGRPIYHGGMFPIWHMRLFRNGAGRCEERRYDQHFHVTGRAQRLSHPFIDDHKMTIGEWTIRHNRWADAEAEEILQPGRGDVIAGRLAGSPIEQKRALRDGYYRLPPFFRALLLFLYRYLFRLGFLDGREGLIYFVLQAFWYRFLVDAKIFERSVLQGKDRHSDAI